MGQATLQQTYSRPVGKALPEKEARTDAVLPFTTRMQACLVLFGLDLYDGYGVRIEIYREISVIRHRFALRSE